ncbi:hypothetical protein [Albidovulum sp.]
MIAFGNIAIHTAKGGKRLGPVGDFVRILSDLPKRMRQLRNADNDLRIHDDHHVRDRFGCGFSHPAGSRPDVRGKCCSAIPWCARMAA